MRRQPRLLGDSSGDGARSGPCQPPRQALRQGPRDRQHQVRRGSRQYFPTLCLSLKGAGGVPGEECDQDVSGEFLFAGTQRAG